MPKCPVCGSEMEISIEEYEIPFFGKSLLFSAVCKHCGYKHSDVFSTEEREPIRLMFKAESEEDLLVRVVRSSQASIEIPELGIRIDPGIMSQGYISNVEGVLRRIEEVLEGQLIVEKDALKRKKVEELLGKIEKMKDGKAEFTLIIEDPSGNSEIASEKTKREKLNLKQGEL